MGRSRASRANADSENGEGDEAGAGAGGEAVASAPPTEAEDRDTARPLKKRDSRNKGGEIPPDDANGPSAANGDNGETAPSTDSRQKRDKAASEDESDEEYEVEAILDSKKIKGKTHFLIRWKGYQSESDSWEPEDTLSCPDLILQFKKQTNGKTKRGPKRKNKSSKAATNNKKQKTAKSPGKKKISNDSEDEDENDEYEVERIIEVHHKKNGNREFLIKWKGWGSDHNTWEPEKNLNCSDLIKKFMEKVKVKKNASPRDLRVAPASTQRFTLSSKDSGRRLSKRSNNKQRVRYDDAE